MDFAVLFRDLSGSEMPTAADMRIFKRGAVAKAFPTALVLGLVWACGEPSTNTGVITRGSSNQPANGSGGSAPAGASWSDSQPGRINTNASNSTVASYPDDAEVVPCTDGDGCMCPKLSVAVIGTAGKWGASSNSNGQDSDTALQDWLNSSSSGTAKVDNFKTKPVLTPDFLAGYDVIILAGLGDDSNTGPWWTFDASEVSAFEDWITNKGGGAISLSGYAGDGNEVNAKNALLAFSGISYNTDGLSPQCALVGPNNSQMCWCDGSEPITEWNRTDAFVKDLSNAVTMVGMQTGRSINAPKDAHVAATVTNGTTYNVLVGEAIGKGRVLVYSDEWITYTSQWNGMGNPNATNPSCVGYLPQDKYQTAQFWYNMIRWMRPDATCFKIVDKNHPVTVW